MRFIFKKELYQPSALFKAAYNFTDKAFIHLDADDENYIVDLEMKKGCEAIPPEQFQNEILAAMVRNDISFRTKNVRELILARALASTVVNPPQDGEEIASTTDSIEDILQDWFERYE